MLLDSTQFSILRLHSLLTILYRPPLSNNCCGSVEHVFQIPLPFDLAQPLIVPFVELSCQSDFITLASFR